VVRNRDGQVVERASGTLSLSRPDRFRWDYRQPYLQTIVADGERLWLYDSDLEQVTVRALEAGLGSTPAMLLSGSGQVGDAFTALALEREGEWTWARLRPEAGELGLRPRRARVRRARVSSPRWNCATSSARPRSSSSATCGAIRRSTRRCSASSLHPAPT
jgi:outer membrane lipoprotein-sorting protein